MKIVLNIIIIELSAYNLINTVLFHLQTQEISCPLEHQDPGQKFSGLQQEEQQTS